MIGTDDREIIQAKTPDEPLDDMVVNDPYLRWIEREGEGGDSGKDLANVKKGSASYAKRHACKNWGMALECWGVKPQHQLVIKNAKTAAKKESDINDTFTDIVEGFLEAAIKVLCAAFAQDHTSKHPLGVNETIYNSIIALCKVDPEHGVDSPDGKAVMEWAKTKNNRAHLKKRGTHLKAEI